MKKENETSTSMDFSSASAIIGGLDSFLEEGVSFNVKPTEETEEHIESPVEIPVGTEEENVENETTDNETVTETLTIEDKDKDKDTDTKTNNSNTFDYKSIINSLVDNKIFEGFDTIETEDGEIPFSEYELDENSFLEIIKAKIDEIKEQTTSNSTNGLSDFTKHLLDIEKNGGNISQALQTYQEIQNPLDSFDLSDEIDQQNVVFMKYHKIMGMEKDVVIDLIEGFIAKGKLEDEANKADTEIRGAVNKQLDAINQQAVQDKAKKKESLKVYRDSLREQLNKFDLNDNYKRKLLDTATKEDDGGNFALDNVYYERRNNPEKAANLLLFLTDEEEYKKQITKNEVRSTQLDTMKKLKLVTKGSKDNIKIGSKEPVKINKDLIDIKDIFGN